MKRNVVVLKKLVLQSGVCFLIRWILDHHHCHLVDFKGERELLQQNGLQGQYQFWLIVFKTCCNFLEELVSSFFPLKWRVLTKTAYFNTLIWEKFRQPSSLQVSFLWLALGCPYLNSGFLNLCRIYLRLFSCFFYVNLICHYYHPACCNLQF